MTLSQKSLAHWFGDLLSATALASPCVASLETITLHLPGGSHIEYNPTRTSIQILVHCLEAAGYRVRVQLSSPKLDNFLGYGSPHIQMHVYFNFLFPGSMLNELYLCRCSSISYFEWSGVFQIHWFYLSQLLVRPFC